jgi:hypothetical protein
MGQSGRAEHTSFQIGMHQAKQLADRAAKQKLDQDGMTRTVWWKQSEKSHVGE